MNTKFSIYGHGGQGVPKTAKILSRAGMLSGFKAQDLTIPTEWGMVSAGFVRLSKNDIMEKGIIEQPDYVVVLEPSVMPKFSELKEGSFLIVNATEKPSSPVLKKKKVRAYYLDATSISLAHKIKPNTPMLGGLLKVFSKISMRNLKMAVEAELPGRQKENQAAVEDGFKMVR